MEHEFKVGDKVMVIDHRPADAEEFPKWVHSMDECAGKTGVVIWVNTLTIQVKFDDREVWVYKPEWIRHAEDGVMIPKIDSIQAAIACFSKVSPSIFQKSPAVSATLIRPKKLLTNIKLE